MARREFAEEIGRPAPVGEWLELGTVRQANGKVVTAYAVPAPEQVVFIESNTFEMEWPRGSGKVATFPEVDRAEWMTAAQAHDRVVAGQRALLDRLEGLVEH